MLEELIVKYTINNKITCKYAFKIAAKTKMHISEVAKKLNDLSIKIQDCDLGQFGKLDRTKSSFEAKKRLQNIMDDKKRVFCKDAREVAKGIGLGVIRGALKEYDIDVKYCELGCFKEKKGKKMRLKTKTWIEDADGQLLFGKGKTEVLELIEQTGSISGASKELGMNYKKTWNHIKILEKNFKDCMVQSKQGGSGSGGSVLTDEAKQTIKKYRQLQNEIEEFANKRFKELFLNK